MIVRFAGPNNSPAGLRSQSALQVALIYAIKR